MNKSDFLREVAANADISITQAGVFYDALIQTVTDTLKKGEPVALMGFGTFEMRKKAARDGINPLTKAKIKIAASNAPAFKFSSAYRKSFN